jgi:hypothetical protein
MLTTSSQNTEYISKDLLIPSWLEFYPKNLDIEIRSVMWRNMVEEKYFKFRVFEDMN